MPVGFEINPNFCFALLGTCAVYFWTRPGRGAWLVVLVLAAAMRLTLLRWTGSLGRYYGVWWISWGPFLGVASLLVLAAQIVRSPKAAQRSLLQTFCAAAIFPLCSMVIAFVLPVTTWLRPKTFDAYLLAFDGGLGVQPSFALGRLLLRSPALWGPTTVAYYAMLFAVCMLYGSYRRRERQPLAMLALLLSMILLGVVLYAIFPAVGPRYTFGRLFPLHAPTVSSLVRMSVPEAPRNCMPSIHFAAALVVWWNAGAWPRWGRLLAFLYVLATAFATLALGEHYLADLVVAIPFTLSLQAVWTRSVEWANRARVAAFWLGAGMTAAWMVALRYLVGVFLISPIVSWALIVITVGVCVGMERKLAGAAEG